MPPAETRVKWLRMTVRQNVRESDKTGDKLTTEFHCRYVAMCSVLSTQRTTKHYIDVALVLSCVLSLCRTVVGEISRAVRDVI